MSRLITVEKRSSQPLDHCAAQCRPILVTMYVPLFDVSSLPSSLVSCDRTFRDTCFARPAFSALSSAVQSSLSIRPSRSWWFFTARLSTKMANIGGNNGLHSSCKRSSKSQRERERERERGRAKRGLSGGGRAVLGGPTRCVGALEKPDFNYCKSHAPIVVSVVCIIIFCMLKRLLFD